MLHIVSSPLEQFEIVPLFPVFESGSFLVYFTNSSFFLLFAVVIGGLFLALSTYNGTLAPSRWQTVVEGIYEFFLGSVFETVGERGARYFPLVFTLFLFLTFCNLMGMVPYSFTPTSHIIVTFTLALGIFLAVNWIAFAEHGMHFFTFFVPKGAPAAMVPLLVAVEVLSYFIRVISLSVRLFANMIAGHCLLKILAGFSWSMLSLGGIFYILQLAPLVVVWAVVGLELGISVLQAYVFTILACMYLGDSINMH